MPQQLTAYSGSGHVYILDDMGEVTTPPPPPPPTTGRRSRRGKRGVQFQTLHTQKVHSVREFFEEYTEYQVHGVKLGADASEADFHTYFSNELATLTSDDLVIIYYNGYSGGKDSKWSWAFEGDFKGPINAYKFIKDLNRTQVDVMVLADCEIHARFTEKWTRKHGSNTEIISAGTTYKNTKGQFLDDTSGDFIRGMILCLSEFVEGINDPSKKCKNPRSIPQLMARYKPLTNNPQRIWIHKPVTGAETIVKRFVFCPTKVRETEMLEFFAMQIQGPGPEDEGFDEIDMDETVAPISQQSIATTTTSQQSDGSVSPGIFVGL